MIPRFSVASGSEPETVLLKLVKAGKWIDMRKTRISTAVGQRVEQPRDVYY